MLLALAGQGPQLDIHGVQFARKRFDALASLRQLDGERLGIGCRYGVHGFTWPWSDGVRHGGYLQARFGLAEWAGFSFSRTAREIFP